MPASATARARHARTAAQPALHAITLRYVEYTNIRRAPHRLLQDLIGNSPLVGQLVETLHEHEVIGFWSQSMHHFIMVERVRDGHGIPRLHSHRWELLSGAILTPDVLQETAQLYGYYIDNLDAFRDRFVRVMTAQNGSLKYGGA